MIYIVGSIYIKLEPIIVLIGSRYGIWVWRFDFYDGEREVVLQYVASNSISIVANMVKGIF